MEGSHSSKSSDAIWRRWKSIVSSLANIYMLTHDLYQLIIQSVNKDNREEMIEQINELLNKREVALQNYNPAPSINDEEVMKEISLWNVTINSRLEEIKLQIQKDLVQLRKAKSSNLQYTNPYQNVATKDGMFYDKKK